MLYIFLLPLLSLSSNYSNDDLIINTEVKSVGYPFLAEDKYFSIQISVKNTSGTLKKFWIYSCTWEDSFITDQECIKLCKKECPSNYPIDINLPNNDSIVFNCIVMVPSTAFKQETFRIGLVLMNETELKNMRMIGVGNSKTIEVAQKALRKYMLTFRIYWSKPIPIHSGPRGFDFNKWRS